MLLLEILHGFTTKFSDIFQEILLGISPRITPEIIAVSAGFLSGNTACVLQEVLLAISPWILSWISIRIPSTISIFFYALPLIYFQKFLLGFLQGISQKFIWRKLFAWILVMSLILKKSFSIQNVQNKKKILLQVTRKQATFLRFLPNTHSQQFSFGTVHSKTYFLRYYIYFFFLRICLKNMFACAYRRHLNLRKLNNSLFMFLNKMRPQTFSFLKL